MKGTYIRVINEHLLSETPKLREELKAFEEALIKKKSVQNTLKEMSLPQKRALVSIIDDIHDKKGLVSIDNVAKNSGLTKTAVKNPWTGTARVK